MEPDTILHISSETETTLRSINNFLLYFLLWQRGSNTHGGSSTRPSFMSMNQLCEYDVVDPGIAKYSIGNIGHPLIPIDFNNYRHHYLQGYWEVKDGRDYSAVSLKLGYPISKTVKLEGQNSNWCYLTKYRRYSDSKEFYFIQLSQDFKGYLNVASYEAISELLQYIKINFPGLYIIVGDFNVQGHEKVFEYFLGEDKYHICPFYKTATCNDNEGVGSPDGLVVSKELYNRVEYAVDFYSGYSFQHFIVNARLFQDSRRHGTYDATDNGFKQFLNLLKEHHYGLRDMFIGHKGIFSPTDPRMIGNPEGVREVQIRSRGPETLTVTNATKFI